MSKRLKGQQQKSKPEWPDVIGGGQLGGIKAIWSPPKSSAPPADKITYEEWATALSVCREAPDGWRTLPELAELLGLGPTRTHAYVQAGLKKGTVVSSKFNSRTTGNLTTHYHVKT